MLKAVGIITLITVCTLAGFKLSEGIKQRHRKLREYCFLLEEIADRIRTGTALFDILSGEKTKELVIVDGLDMRVNKGWLTARDKEILDEFFSKLGFSDKKGETDRCAAYLELLKKQEKDAENQVKAKAGLYSKLGFFAGLFIAVVLV